jgi:hypothetical protein
MQQQLAASEAKKMPKLQKASVSQQPASKNVDWQ